MAFTPRLTTALSVGLWSAAVLLTGAPPTEAAGAGLQANSTGLAPVDAVVLPDTRYLLTAPSDATVIKAPQIGKVHFPAPELPSNPLELLSLLSSWESGEEDPFAVAILKFPVEVTHQISIKQQRSKIYDQFLRDYGQRGLDEPALNFAWSWEYDDEKRAAKFAAVNIVNGDEGELRKLRADIAIARLNGPIPDTLRKFSEQIEAKLALRSTFNDSVWVDILDKAIVYNLRNVLDLNSTANYISLGSNDTADLAPNLRNPYNYSMHNRLEFVVSRTVEGSDFGDRNLQRFCRYWSAVARDNLYSDDDFVFLDTIASYNKELTIDRASTSKILIDECLDAVQDLEKWRSATQILAKHVNSSNDYDDKTDFGSRLSMDLNQNLPSLSDATVQNFIQAGLTAFRKGAPDNQIGRPRSSGAAVSWLADQARMGWAFNGRIISASEIRGAYAGGGHVDHDGDPLVHFVLLDSSFRGPLELPLSTGGPSWRQLQENSASVATIDGALKEPDPFNPLVWQTIVTLSPTVDAASRIDSSADELYSAGELVSIFRADLLGKIRKAAPAVRDYGRELLNQYAADTRALRYGHFAVPEPAIVDSVSVTDGESVNAGTPISILRPIYRYKLQVKLTPSMQASKLFLPGTTLRWKLSCDGPIDTTSDEKRAIVSSPGSADAMKLLKELKSYYLNKIIFKGQLYYVDSEPGLADLQGFEQGRSAKLSFSIPERDRMISVDRTSVSNIYFTKVPEILSSLGFRFKSQSNPAGSAGLLILDAGPLTVGELCKANFVFPEQRANDALKLDEDWNRLKSLR